MCDPKQQTVYIIFIFGQSYGDFPGSLLCFGLRWSVFLGGTLSGTTTDFPFVTGRYSVACLDAQAPIIINLLQGVYSTNTYETYPYKNKMLQPGPKIAYKSEMITTDSRHKEHPLENQEFQTNELRG